MAELFNVLKRERANHKKYLKENVELQKQINVIYEKLEINHEHMKI